MAYRPLPPKKPDDPVDGAQIVARIDALTRNARSTWFALLSGLLFVGITLMGVEHIDFYGVNRATKLPLINVEVPTRLFFLAAPILIAAIYGYFHLYLIRLWEALGKAPAHVGGTRLGEAITPWLVTDAALHRRRKKRDDDCAEPRALERESMLLNFLLAWVFGPAILTLLWWESMTARSILMAGIAGASLFVSLAAGFISLVVMLRRMRGLTHGERIAPRRRAASLVIGVLLIIFIAVITAGRTRQFFGWAEDFTTNLSTSDHWAASLVDLAPINLAGQSIVETPSDWLPHRFAREDYLNVWCRREAPACNPPKAPKPSGDRAAGVAPPAAFEQAWRARRNAAVSALAKPLFNPITPELYNLRHSGAATWWRRPPDLRRANLENANLSGLNLILADLRGANLTDAGFERALMMRAQMQGAVLRGVQMVGADLRGAQMVGSVLSEAQLQGADLSEAQMQGAVLRGAQMQAAVLKGAQMRGADLIGAQMRGADLRGVQMQEADLRGAQMVGADLRGALIVGAFLSGAQMHGADLSWAQMVGADLSEAQLQGADFSGAQMVGAVLSEAQMQGVVLSEAQMQGADLSEAQMVGADLSYSWIAGRADLDNVLAATNLMASINNGGAMRFVDLRPAILDGADFRNAFLDGSVNVPDRFREAMGDPCQWLKDPIEDDATFFGLWRAWVESKPGSATWAFFAPEEWHEVDPLPLPPGCEMKELPPFENTANAN